MKALVLTAPEKIETREMPKPEIADDEVLVKLEYCGICTLEQRLYSGAMKIFLPHCSRTRGIGKGGTGRARSARSSGTGTEGRS